MERDEGRTGSLVLHDICAAGRICQKSRVCAVGLQKIRASTGIGAGREFASPGGWAISNYFTLQTWPTGTSPSLEVLSEHTFVLGALESHLDCYTAIKRNQALLLRPRWNLARLTINRCSMEWACRG